MMSLILKMLLPEILALVQTAFKNPKSIAAEIAVITEIRDLLNGIIEANPKTPPTP